MAAMTSLVIFMALVTIQVAAANLVDYNVPGCTVPGNLAPKTPSQMEGRPFYLLATVNFNPSMPITSTCIKMGYYFYRGSKGVSEETSVSNNGNGNFGVNLYQAKYVKPGFFVFHSIKDRTLRILDYIMWQDANGYVATCCYVRNGTAYEQSYGYIGYSRTVPRATILQAYRNAGVTIRNQFFVSQDNCSN